MNSDNEIILTEVFDSETDDIFTFTKDPSFAFDISLQSVSLLLVIHPDDSYDEMSALYEAMTHNSILEMQLHKTVVNYKSSPCDMELGLNIHSLSLIDHDRSSLCPVDRRQFIVIGSDSDPMIQGKILLVDNSSKLFCEVNVGTSQIQITPFLLSLPFLPHRASCCPWTPGGCPRERNNFLPARCTDNPRCLLFPTGRR